MICEQCRDEAQAKIAELKERAVREAADFESKLRDLAQQIATDKRNKEFLQLMQVRLLLNRVLIYCCVWFVSYRLCVCLRVCAVG